MDDFFQSMSSQAIALYFAYHHFGSMPDAQMARKLNKSIASIYRAKAELRSAGYLTTERVVSVGINTIHPIAA